MGVSMGASIVMMSSDLELPDSVYGIIDDCGFTSILDVIKQNKNKQISKYISKGMISRLGHEFARKTENERKETFKDMLLTPVMHTDCTNARYNGKSAYVFICADPKGNALYFARKHKGLEGVKGTVTEDYQGTLVHDHELTFLISDPTIRNVSHTSSAI